MLRSFRVLAVLALCFTGCSDTQEEEQKEPVRSSFEGCRSPDEPGCEVCCEPTGTRCVELSWSGGSSHATPYYNVTTYRDDGCVGCTPCAQCSRREEEELRALAVRTDCDCRQDPGVDPCRDASGCGCYCSRLLYLKESCPEVPQGVPAP